MFLVIQGDAVVSLLIDQTGEVPVARALREVCRVGMFFLVRIRDLIGELAHISPKPYPSCSPDLNFSSDSSFPAIGNSQAM